MKNTSSFFVPAAVLFSLLSACNDPDRHPATPSFPDKDHAQTNAPAAAAPHPADEEHSNVKPIATYHAGDAIDAKVLGMPVYPNTRIRNSGTWELLDHEEGAQALISLQVTSDDPLNKVVAFYRQRVPDARFIEIERAGSKRVSIIVSLPDQTTASAVIRESGSGTAIEYTKLSTAAPQLDNNTAR